MTLDEVISYNLRRAREFQGWTQIEAAERISAHLGRAWSQQVYGDAERAYRSERVKVFNGEELLALALAFELPILWFYFPPSVDSRIAARGSSEAISGRDLMSLLFPSLDRDRSRSAAALRGRLEELAEEGDFDPEDVSFTPESDLAQRVFEQVMHQLGKNVDDLVKRRVEERVMQQFAMGHGEDDEPDPLSDDPAERAEQVKAQRDANEGLLALNAGKRERAEELFRNASRRRKEGTGDGEGTDSQDRPE